MAASRNLLDGLIDGRTSGGSQPESHAVLGQALQDGADRRTIAPLNERVEPILHSRVETRSAPIVAGPAGSPSRRRLVAAESLLRSIE